MLAPESIGLGFCESIFGKLLNRRFYSFLTARTFGSGSSQILELCFLGIEITFPSSALCLSKKMIGLDVFRRVSAPKCALSSIPLTFSFKKAHSASLSEPKAIASTFSASRKPRHHNPSKQDFRRLRMDRS